MAMRAVMPKMEHDGTFTICTSLYDFPWVHCFRPFKRVVSVQRGKNEIPNAILFCDIGDDAHLNEQGRSYRHKEEGQGHENKECLVGPD